MGGYEYYNLVANINKLKFTVEYLLTCKFSVNFLTFASLLYDKIEKYLYVINLFLFLYKK